MNYSIGIHLHHGDEISIERITDTPNLAPYARLKLGGFLGVSVYPDDAQVAELHRLTGEYLEARKAEAVADVAVAQWEAEGGQAAEVANG